METGATLGRCSTCNEEVLYLKSARRTYPVFCGPDCVPEGAQGVVLLDCQGCGVKMQRSLGEYRKNKAHFHSRECYAENGSDLHKLGGRSRASYWVPGWPPNVAPEVLAAAEKYGEPTAWCMDGEYRSFRWTRHPGVGANGRMAEHRAVAYEYVGDGIRGMHVDHDDNDTTNNAWSNLVVMTPGEHGQTTWRRDGNGVGVAFLKWARVHRPDIVEEWESSIHQ